MYSHFHVFSLQTPPFHSFLHSLSHILSFLAKTQSSTMEKTPFSHTSSSIFITFLSLYLTLIPSLAMENNTSIMVKVGVILDSDTWFGKIGLTSMEIALSDFYDSHENYKTKLLLFPRNSKRDIIEAASAALELVKNEEVEAVIGPQNSNQANFIADIGRKSQVPIISFSSTTPSLNSLKNPYFFQATQKDSFQVKPIASIFKAFSWRQAVVLHAAGDEYTAAGFMPSMKDALSEINTVVSYETVIPLSASDDRIAKELYKLMTMQTRVLIVHMLPELGCRIFAIAKEIGMMEKGYVWIMTNGMSDFLSMIDHDSFAMDSMNGVLGVRTYFPRTLELDDFQQRWEKKFREENPDAPLSVSEPNVFGLRAYDACFALAQAVEMIGNTEFGLKKANVSGKSTDLDTLGVSQNGPKLCEALSKTQFKGLAGEFSLVERQLKSSTFEIINLNQGNSIVVGFWTPEKGLQQTLDSTNISTNFSVANLGHIIWPGDPITFPKGWEIPTNEKKLRIGIPVKSGFSKFVREIRDPITNRTKMTGYSIDIFEAAVEALPYAVFYEYIRFADQKGAMAGTYEQMVEQVYKGTYDAVVGDVAIRESRSKNVDFTLPYSESSVSMIVLLKDNKHKKAWLFLKPLTWDLWVTSACFFVFVGLIIWILEHRINEDFRGPPSHEIGTTFWFSFSTMVYAPSARVESNFGRFVVIVWLFVVLILTQSYTASLSSLLTVQKLEPTFIDMKQLKEQMVPVGYPNGSFVHELLKAEGFDETQLVIYNNLAHCGELFLNRTIVAAFDEIPYLKVVTTTYCTDCTMIGPMMKSNGFGFVFPKGSSLGRDVSKGILDIMEAGKLKEIEDKWFKTNISSPDPKSLVSTTLGLESFWGLFVIIGAAASCALIVSLASFLHQHRDVLKLSTLSLWNRLLILFKLFNQKESNSPRKGQEDESREVKDVGFEPHPGLSCHSSYINGELSLCNFDDFHSDQIETPQPSPSR